MYEKLHNLLRGGELLNKIPTFTANKRRERRKVKSFLWKV
jgi:hypothetical protein